MNTAKWIIVIFCLPTIVLAKTMMCPAYYPQNQNNLIRVDMYDVSNQTVYGINPTENRVKGEMVIQYWDGFLERPDIKTYFTCSYQNTDKKISRQLPTEIKGCRFTYPYPGKAKLKGTEQFTCF